MSDTFCYDTTNLADVALILLQSPPLFFGEGKLALTSFCVFSFADTDCGQHFILGCNLGLYDTSNFRVLWVAFLVVLLDVLGLVLPQPCLVTYLCA